MIIQNNLTQVLRTSMEYRDYYEILRENKNATPDEIKKQYRRMARKYHPDVSKEANAEDKFKEVKEAYEVLKDPEKRQAFDQLGRGQNCSAGFEPPPNWQYQSAQKNQGSAFSEDGFSDFFSSIFGQHNDYQATQKQRGQDHTSRITITLEEAFQGTSKVINIQYPFINPDTGQSDMYHKELKVKVPKGIKQGQHIRLSKQGSPGTRGGDPGDLYLEIDIAKHPLFTLKDNDIFLNVPITPWEAALGASITLPTLAGPIDLKIPANSQSGKKFRIKGRGLPGKATGNQYVILNIEIPEPTTQEQRELYQSMANTMPFNPRKHLTLRGAS